MLIQQAALSVWPASVLIQKTVTGTLSNCAIPEGHTVVKPALTPQKLDALYSQFYYFYIQSFTLRSEQRGGDSETTLCCDGGEQRAVITT